MTPEVRHNPQQDRFEVVLDGTLAGITEYERDGAVLTFPHTEVFDGYEGRGLGSSLIQGALDTCRAEGWTVVARCSFVRSFIDSHPDYADLLAS